MYLFNSNISARKLRRQDEKRRSGRQENGVSVSDSGLDLVTSALLYSLNWLEHFSGEKSGQFHCSGVGSVAELTDKTPQRPHTSRPDRPFKWAADLHLLLSPNIRYLISPRREHFFMYFFQTGLHFLRCPGHGNGLLTPDLERAPGELAQLCRVERASSAWMVQNWYAAHIIFLSSPAWFALTLFKMEEEISLRGVSCPEVHDHSDLMCTVSAISREGHKDQSLKVGLSAI